VIEYNVIQGGRQTGKSTALMTAVHQFIMDGNGASEVLVVVPSHNYINWWTRTWQRRFPAIPVPPIISITNRMRVRGMQVKKIVVEDVNIYPDGISDIRLRDIFPAMRDGEVVFTSSNDFPLNSKSHNLHHYDHEDLLRAKIRKARQARELRNRFDMAAIMAKLIVDTDDKDLIDAVLSGKISPAAAVDLAYEHEERRKAQDGH